MLAIEKLLRPNTAERFWASVKVGNDEECWNFTKKWGRDRPQFFLMGHYVAPHRVAYVLEHGGIPAGYKIVPSCGNESCCNPDHLSAVKIEGRKDIGEISKSLAGPNHPCSKWSADEREQALWRVYDGKETVYQVAKATGIPHITVSRWVKEYARSTELSLAGQAKSIPENNTGAHI